MNQKDEKKSINREEQLEKVLLEGAAAETVQRFGDAAKQHYVAYSGIDNEVGKTLKKGLKSISESKVDSNYNDINIKQQAGYSAEVKTVARNNAARIINGDTVRSTRTDDIGQVNHPLYDIVDIDANGNIISGSGLQMKFVGSNPVKLLQKLNSKDYQKYFDENVLFGVADDDYAALMGSNGNPGLIDQKLESLRKQLAHAEQKGNKELAASKKAQIEKCETLKKNLRKTGMTRDEAIEARLHPKLSTAKDVVKVAHKAGVYQAGIGAAASGSLSIIKNVVACTKGDKEPLEAAASVVKDTGRGAVVSYATAFAGSTVKGAMQNSASTYVRSLAKTNLASGFITTSIDIGKTMRRFIRGDIDGAECVEELGENGVGELGAAMFSTIGISVIPKSAKLLRIVGGAAGSLFGYTAAVAVYQELSTSLKEAKLAHEDRLRIEAECSEAIELIKQYRAEMNSIVDQYLSDYYESFNSGFEMLDKSILENDIDGFIKGNAEIQMALGRSVQFSSQSEFDLLMESDEPLKL